MDSIITKLFKTSTGYKLTTALFLSNNKFIIDPKTDDALSIDDYISLNSDNIFKDAELTAEKKLQVIISLLIQTYDSYERSNRNIRNRIFPLFVYQDNYNSWFCTTFPKVLNNFYDGRTGSNNIIHDYAVFIGY